MTINRPTHALSLRGEGGRSLRAVLSLLLALSVVMSCKDERTVIELKVPPCALTIQNRTQWPLEEVTLIYTQSASSQSAQINAEPLPTDERLQTCFSGDSFLLRVVRPKISGGERLAFTTSSTISCALGGTVTVEVLEAEFRVTKAPPLTPSPGSVDAMTPLTDQSSDRGLDRDLDRDLDRALDRDLDRALDRDLDRALDRDLDRGLDRDLDQSPNQSIDGGADLDRGAADLWDRAFSTPRDLGTQSDRSSPRPSLDQGAPDRSRLDAMVAPTGVVACLAYDLAQPVYRSHACVCSDDSL